MSRGYRGIFFALVGVVLLGATPPKTDQPKPAQNSNAKIERSLEDMSASLKQANEPSTLEQPCEEGTDDRSSDLCAQWKAADAAASGARATWVFGALGTLIGALTLGAAAAAAFFAREAARHTEAGALEAARGATAAQNAYQAYLTAERAIIRIVDADFRKSSNDHSAAQWEFAITLLNHGRSNAFVSNVGWTIGTVPLYLDKTGFEYWPNEFIGIGENTEINPLPIYEIPEYPILIMGYVEYKTLGDLRFRTHFSYKVTHLNRNAMIITHRSHETDWNHCADLPADT